MPKTPEKKRAEVSAWSKTEAGKASLRRRYQNYKDKKRDGNPTNGWEAKAKSLVEAMNTWR